MSISSIFSLAIIFLIITIIVLALVYLSMTLKEKNEGDKNAKQSGGNASGQNGGASAKEKTAKSYTKESIFNFMEFDRVEDNMIVQKGGKRFLMVIECQGINYDLMSDMEKTAVESGFIQFLNTLRNPIQIYVQTRTVNLEDSLRNYKEKLKKIENELTSKETKYKAMQESGKYSQKLLNAQMMEVRRQKNLYEYGRDIIINTERMSMNKNVLRKKYYLILSYYYNENDSYTDEEESETMKEGEILETAFSDLYTKCQSAIRALAISGVNGKVLDSYELVDLLYNAYNRDEAENYGIERAMSAGYDNLYVTSQDILTKKMNAIDKEITDRALSLAQDSIKYANEEMQKQIEDKEENLDDLISNLAEALIAENEEFLPEEVSEEAKKQVRKTTKEKKETKEKGGAN